MQSIEKRLIVKSDGVSNQSCLVSHVAAIKQPDAAGVVVILQYKALCQIAQFRRQVE